VARRDSFTVRARHSICPVVLSGALLSRPAEGIFKEDIADPISRSVKIVDYG